MSAFKFPIRLRTVACLGVLVALTMTSSAHETDQFTLPMGREFVEVGEVMNAWAYETIERGVAKANRDIQRAIDSGRPETVIQQLQSKDAIFKAVYPEFGSAYYVIEDLEAMVRSRQVARRFPGRIFGFREQFRNIFENAHFILDPRQLFRIWHASTLKVYGTYLGTDKIGHFTDMGKHYYRAYLAALEKGMTEEEAIRDAVDIGQHGAIFSERGMVGYLSAGAYSNADMVANYLGFLFYKNLTEPVTLNGELRPAMLKLEGNVWTIAPHVRRDSDFFKWFICDHLNEAMNPSHFEAAMRHEIWRALSKRTEVILDRYSDQHGNRRSQKYFRTVANDFRTYFGQDYGHHGPHDELVTVADACFSTFTSNAEPYVRDPSGLTPLHVAAWTEKGNELTRLLQLDADVNIQVRSDESYSSEWGNTPLHYAAAEGHTAICQTLIEHGANVNAKNDRGQTPLHRAVEHVDTVKLLIEHGADVRATDSLGQTPLHWAAGDNCTETIRVLMNHDASAEARDHRGYTPLHAAARNGNTTSMKIILDASAESSPRAEFGITPLHLAVLNDETTSIDLLLAHDANVFAIDDFGWTALHTAARYGKTDATTILINAGVNPDVIDTHGTTPLHLAVRHGKETMARALLAEGAAVNMKNNRGITPLHEAAFSGKRFMAALLLENGANPNLRDQNGLTALALASRKGHRDVVNVIRNHLSAAMNNIHSRSN